MYAIEDVARILRDTRHATGLSQRALSAKTGLTQAHISKIENATVDIQLSNLIELTRALNLEIVLVPRPALPAVQAIIRSVTNAKGQLHEPRSPTYAYQLDEDKSDA